MQQPDRIPNEAAETAAEAFARYQAFLASDALVQSTWHDVAEDGRQLACGLGVLGPDVDSPADCPSAIMPRWLAQMVPWLFDGQDFADAKDWGLRFYAELKRLGGNVPFTVVHDWQANVVCLLGLEWRALRKVSPDATKAVQSLHIRALTGDLAPRTEWFEALRPMLKESYVNAYAYAYASTCANADADADAYAYAYASTYANADANAYANTNAYSNAYAYADANRLRRQQAIKRLADGLVECLARVEAA